MEEAAVPFDDRTLAFYDNHALEYASSQPDSLAADLLAFLPHLAPGSQILELGCGSGDTAAALERLGHHVDATDGRTAMVQLASAKLSRPAKMLRFDQLDSKSAYDAVIANASILHVPHPALPSLLARVHRALKPGGWHFANYKTMGKAGWDRHDRYYNRLSRSDAERFYNQAGAWFSLDFYEYEGCGYFSRPSRWLVVTARKG